jgi:hypothetical protein
MVGEGPPASPSMRARGHHTSRYHHRGRYLDAAGRRHSRCGAGAAIKLCRTMTYRCCLGAGAAGFEEGDGADPSGPDPTPTNWICH